MNKQEFGLLAAAIKTAYANEKMFPNNQAMELWYRNLKDIPYEVASAAFDKWVVTSRWAPTIADIREMSTNVINGDAMLWSDG
ncbi:replicative helicase loader/inhibitor [Anaerovoracaceae bacterium 41-7]